MERLRLRSTVLERLAAGLIAAAFLNMAYVRWDFTRRMPEAPDRAARRTEEIDGNYGKHLFVTVREKRRFDWSHYAVLPSAGVTLLLFVVARARRQIAGR